VPHHKETKVFVAHLAAVDQGIRYPQVGAHCDPQGESGGPPLRRPAGHLLEMAPRQAPPPASTRLLWPPVAWAMWARQQSTETSEGLWGRPSPFFLSTNIHTNVHTTLSATSICGANVCKWALCTTTSF
jgi:hypothetical protein